jgi:hypothetical protein
MTKNCVKQHKERKKTVPPREVKNDKEKQKNY